ncbi:MAG TPA: PQQ-dependent sugar dehydrogenase [Pyrinomonadaceae bacterium]|nr:PQQ-dependent sugar dehydrogenase [Pyrinomonadaceae bacterium]
MSLRASRREASLAFVVSAALAALAAVLLIDARVRVPRLAAAAQTSELPTLALTSPVTGFSQPVAITHAGDGSNRLFVVEQGGRIRLVKNGALQSAPFLDISARVSAGGERGLLGLAFPPGYASKGHFYVNYTRASDGATVIARYRRNASNPDAADPSSEQIVLTIGQPFANHNGGQLSFSPRDGFLYVGMGDGGSGGDPGNRAQNPADLLGKMLRIDTEAAGTTTYAVPPSNPFAGRAGFRQEIWALGLRNPWRFSFDRQTGDLFIADVGQGSWEEVNFQPAASAGGENYGWRVMEGTHCFNPNPCDPTGLTLPVREYDHSQGCSVTGGHVYRGTSFPRMQGLYIYADFCSGVIWGLRRVGGVWQNSVLLDTSLSVSTFGEDESGELYVASYGGGTIFRVTDSAPAPTPTPSPIPPAPSTYQFSAAQYTGVEGCAAVTVTVTRTPFDSSGAVGVTLSDGTAKQKSDYTLAPGRVVFQVNQASQTFSVLLNEDAFAEGTETATLGLADPAFGGSVGAQGTATLVITDDETVDGATNPIDVTDNFVCQHYHDFLGRQPDAAGQSFWAGQLNACGGNAACLDDRRESVSAAFFLSIEFQNTGYFVYRFEKASFDRRPRYASFVADVRRVAEGVVIGEPGAEARLGANRREFVAAWVARQEFRDAYDALTNAQYVNALFANSDVTPTAAERDALVSALNTGAKTRAEVLHEIVESPAVYNAQYNPAFVLMEYFGYLRRDPDDAGFNFWLGKMNEHSRPGEDVRSDSVAFARARRAQMVRSFLVSTEYRERFGRP